MLLPEVTVAGIFDTKFMKSAVAIKQTRIPTTFEIELPTEPGGTCYINDVAYPITPNRIIFVKPGQERYTIAPFRCHYIHFNADDPELKEVLMAMPDSFETDKEEEYRALLSRVVRHARSFSPDSRYLVYSRMMELIYFLRTDAAMQDKGLGASHQLLVQEALTYIKEHLTEDLTLEKVAAAMSFSPIYFHNVFKAAMGRTLRKYVEEQRIRKATNLLLTTDDSLTKIAFECGFSSQSYFSYVFKRRMNQTPREYVRDAYHKYEI